VSARPAEDAEGDAALRAAISFFIPTISSWSRVMEPVSTTAHPAKTAAIAPARGRTTHLRRHAVHLTSVRSARRRFFAHAPSSCTGSSGFFLAEADRRERRLRTPRETR